MEARPNDKQRALDRALIRACLHGDADEARRCLERGANTTTTYRKDAPSYPKASFALAMAAIQGHPNLVGLLVDAGAPIDQTDAHGATALMLAAHAGEAESVDRLIRAGADIHKADPSGSTPLAYAARGDDERGSPCVERLLLAGASIDAPDRDGNTPLMIASIYGRLEHVKRLVAAGADIGRVDVEGRSALDMARSGSDQECAQFLAGWARSRADRAALDAALAPSPSTARPRPRSL